MYPYLLDIKEIEATIKTLHLPIILTRDIIQADIILALRSNVKHNLKLRQIAKSKKVTIYTIQSFTLSNIIRALKQIMHINSDCDNWIRILTNKTYIEKEVLLEARFAIEKIIFLKQQSVELLPQSVKLRKLQHDLVSDYNLKSRSFGEEPNRSLRIYCN